MIEAAGVAPGDRVLEVGAGSGYAAAVMARIAGEVFAIERHAALAEAAQRARCASSATATSRSSPATAASAGRSTAPFDAILVAAGGARCPSR